MDPFCSASTNEKTTINQHLTPAERFDQESNDEYTIRGCDINERRPQPTRLWFYFNALRELNQKRAKNDTVSQAIRRKQKKKPGTVCPFECPRCHTFCKNLENAHVGKRASDIIYEILDLYPEELDLMVLDQYVREAHNDVNFVVVCKLCNNIFDDN